MYGMIRVRVRYMREETADPSRPRCSTCLRRKVQSKLIKYCNNNRNNEVLVDRYEREYLPANL